MSLARIFIVLTSALAAVGIGVQNATAFYDYLAAVGGLGVTAAFSITLFAIIGFAGLCSLAVNYVVNIELLESIWERRPGINIFGWQMLSPGNKPAPILKGFSKLGYFLGTIAFILSGVFMALAAYAIGVTTGSTFLAVAIGIFTAAITIPQELESLLAAFDNPIAVKAYEAKESLNPERSLEEKKNAIRECLSDKFLLQIQKIAIQKELTKVKDAIELSGAKYPDEFKQKVDQLIKTVDELDLEKDPLPTKDAETIGQILKEPLVAESNEIKTIQSHVAKLTQLKSEKFKDVFSSQEVKASDGSAVPAGQDRYAEVQNELDALKKDAEKFNWEISYPFSWPCIVGSLILGAGASLALLYGAHISLLTSLIIGPSSGLIFYPILKSISQKQFTATITTIANTLALSVLFGVGFAFFLIKIAHLSAIPSLIGGLSAGLVCSGYSSWRFYSTFLTKFCENFSENITKKLPESKYWGLGLVAIIANAVVNGILGYTGFEMLEKILSEASISFPSLTPYKYVAAAFTGLASFLVGSDFWIKWAKKAFTVETKEQNTAKAEDNEAKERLLSKTLSNTHEQEVTAVRKWINEKEKELGSPEDEEKKSVAAAPPHKA